MKSAKASAAEGSSSRRSQPARQARTNPSRVSKAAKGRDSLGTAAASDQPIDIFPAITHFADCINDLPKELVRHFTLLKEVDAKIYAPEDTLSQLGDAAKYAPPPQPNPQPNENATQGTAPDSAPMSAQNSSTGVATGGAVAETAPSATESQAPSTVESTADPRRQIYSQIAYKIQEMLGSLEEKNHVISTANDALQKQLARIDEVWPHVENEFSDEAKWGSTTHWAYPENRVNNKAAHAERSRREGAAAISAAAQQLAEEAAARSDARKQAVQAKKNQRQQQQQQQHQDSDMDDQSKAEATTTATKKGSKARKAAAEVGLGITTNGTTNGSAPQPKRRKVDKGAAAGNAPASAMSTVFGNTAPKAKTSSPRGTPAPEGQKKRKALPSAAGGQTKKRNGASASASAASSPVIGAFNEPKPTRGSPAPSTKGNTTSRGRKNSVKSTAAAAAAAEAAAAAAENANNARPASSASNKPNGAAPSTPKLPPPTDLPRPNPETKAGKDMNPPVKTEGGKGEAEAATPPAEVGTILNATAINKKDKTKQEETERKSEQPTTQQPGPVSTPVAGQAAAPTVTKSGRASKPSTPVLATFQEAAAARPRASRNSESKDSTSTANTNNGNGNGHSSSSAASNGGTGNGNGKRKKNTPAAQQQQQHNQQPVAPPAVAKLAEEDAASSSAQGDEDDGDIDADEPLYCYCNSVSYGEMVACDADDCEREWFHLECVGLKVAPKGNAKWYCEPCKKRLTANGKKLNGR